MKQLELRFYPREEIAEILSLRTDSKNFKRDVENKLSKWGYTFRYISRKGVEIQKKPETNAERIAEILYRGYGIDIQISSHLFACFLTAFSDIEGFSSMPWEKRADEFYRRYGCLVSERTLRNWCSNLVSRGVISIGGTSSAWITMFENGKKIRRPVEKCDEAAMQQYYDRRKELYQSYFKGFVSSNIPPNDAKNQAWKKTYEDLWSEYGCCYYYCKSTVLSAFSYNDVDLFEIYELAREIAPDLPPEEPTLVDAQTSNQFIF